MDNPTRSAPRNRQSVCRKPRGPQQVCLLGWKRRGPQQVCFLGVETSFSAACKEVHPSGERSKLSLTLPELHGTFVGMESRGRYR